jgi:hypothetical protein
MGIFPRQNEQVHGTITSGGPDRREAMMDSPGAGHAFEAILIDRVGLGRPSALISLGKELEVAELDLQ